MSLSQDGWHNNELGKVSFRAMNGFFGAVQSHWANEQYSAVQSTRAWPDFSLVSVRASRFQSNSVQELTLKLRRKPVQSQSTLVKIGATLTKRIGFFPSAARLNGILIYDRSLSRCANWFDSLFEANLTNGCPHHLKFFKKFSTGSRPFDAQYYSLVQ